MMDGVYRPFARSAELVVEPVDDELLVFGSERQVAHSLNQVAAAVWRACDGSRSVGEIAQSCGLEREAVELALVELANIDLLVGEPPAATSVSRRQLLRRATVVGAAAGFALPVIRSITAPTPAMAASAVRHKGKATQPCASSAQCSPSPVSFCNGLTGSCQRHSGQSCSHISSCQHFSGKTNICRGGVCAYCSNNAQCPTSHPTCNSSRFCV